MTNSDRLSDSDWLSYVEAAARGDMDGDPDATKTLDEMGPAAVILRLVNMVRQMRSGVPEIQKIQFIASVIARYPCERCDPHETGSPCNEHGENCWSMYMAEAEHVYREFVLPLENELRNLKEKQETGENGL